MKRKLFIFDIIFLILNLIIFLCLNIYHHFNLEVIILSILTLMIFLNLFFNIKTQNYDRNFLFNINLVFIIFGYTFFKSYIFINIILRILFIIFCFYFLFYLLLVFKELKQRNMKVGLISLTVMLFFNIILNLMYLYYANLHSIEKVNEILIFRK